MKSGAVCEFDLFTWCRERIKPNWKTAFWSALLTGLAVHLYKFTNTLYNHDALYSVYGSNDMVSVGRWLLGAACLPSSCFDLPWVNGLFTLLWIALTAAVLADLFDIQKTAPLILTGALLVSFPSVTSTIFFEYLSDGFMLSMLLSALAVRFSMVGDRVKAHVPLAAALLCLSCGIYQAYVSFALLLSMCHFMLELLKGGRDKKDYFRWIGKQFLVYGLGLAAYYAVWQLRLRLGHIAVTDYQGVSQLGDFSVAMLLGAVAKTARTLAAFFLGGNVFKYGWSFYAVLNAAFLLLLAAALVCAACRARIWRTPERLVLLLLSLLSLPVFACIWYFLSPSVIYHGVMLQSLCVLYIFALLLTDRLFRLPLRNAAMLFFALLALKFGLMANAAYFEMERSNRASLVTASEMLACIHQQDDGSVTRIAFLGSRDRSLAQTGAPGADGMLVLAHQIRPNLIYDHTYASLYFVNVLDSGYVPLSGSELEELEASGEADGMPVWPRQGSVRIIGDTAVIRLAEEEAAP